MLQDAQLELADPAHQEKLICTNPRSDLDLPYEAKRRGKFYYSKTKN